MVASKVYLAIPNMGWLHAELIARLVPWLRDWKVLLSTPTGLRPIPYARNRCVAEFLKTDCTHLWFIDADTLPPADALELLLGACKLAVSGLVYTMKLDDDGLHKPVAMVLRRNGDGDLKDAYGEGVEPIDASGSGCVLYQRQVFEAIDCPWYEDRAWGAVRGSDFLFAKKLRSAAIPLHAHFGVICRHRKEVEF